MSSRTSRTVVDKGQKGGCSEENHEKLTEQDGNRWSGLGLVFGGNWRVLTI